MSGDARSRQYSETMIRIKSLLTSFPPVVKPPLVLDLTESEPTLPVTKEDTLDAIQSCQKNLDELKKCSEQLKQKFESLKELEFVKLRERSKIEQDASKGTSPIPIPCYNWVDTAKFPANFCVRFCIVIHC
jgi:hypothetical protein